MNNKYGYSIFIPWASDISVGYYVKTFFKGYQKIGNKELKQIGMLAWDFDNDNLIIASDFGNIIEFIWDTAVLH